MKNIFKYLLVLITVVQFGCNESEDVMTGEALEGARVALIDNSTGQLAGSPETGVELEDAEISFQATKLAYTATVTNNADEVEKLTVFKSFKGQVVEVASSTEDKVSVSYDGVDDFLQGFQGIAASDLRVGDQIAFYTEITMADGRVLVDQSANLGVNVSCLSDLTGTYLATNDFCNPTPFSVTITQNSDGSYTLTSADGGWLNTCTNNPTLVNSGTIIEQCGEILPSTDLAFGTDGGYGIGDVTGGTWDAATGTLTLENKDVYFNGGPYEWTSTYVRQ